MASQAQVRRSRSADEWSDGSLGEGTALDVAVPVVNMFLRPEHDASVGSQAIYGQRLTLVRTEPEWLCVRSADAYMGWVVRSSVNMGQERGTGLPVHVATLSANVYREPDVKAHAPVLRLPWEAQLTLSSADVDHEQRWLEVRLVSGEMAYVQRGDVSLERPLLSQEQMLALAHQFLGITYTWGGTSSFGFDCSGLTQMLLRQRGLNMPRDAHLQAAWEGSFDVAPEEIRGGDLLFFAEAGDRITHTGMALDGRRFVHASARGRPGVQISEIAEAHWRELLAGQRRAR